MKTKEIRKTIAFVKVEFKGLYSWGKGWESMDKCVQWKKFWQENGDGLWKHVAERSSLKSEYLVSSSGSAYLHPMGFEMTLTGCGIMSGDGSYLGFEIEALYNLCKKCAGACDAQFTMEVSDERKVVLCSRKFKKS